MDCISAVLRGRLACIEREQVLTTLNYPPPQFVDVYVLSKKEEDWTCPILHKFTKSQFRFKTLKQDEQYYFSIAIEEEIDFSNSYTA